MPALRCCPPVCAAVDGNFSRGDAVTVQSQDGQRFAQGLSAYGSTEAAAIAGHRSDQIEAILGWRGRDEMIHRDDLVLYPAAQVLGSGGNGGPLQTRRKN